MARINIIPSQSGPSFIDELGDFLQAVQQGKQRQAEEETQALLLGALQQPDPQAAIISALSERSANRPTGGAGFLDRLNPFTPARGQTQAGSSLIPMLAKGALGGTGPTQQQQFTRGVSQAKDEQKDIEDDLKHVRSAIKWEEGNPDGPDPTTLATLRTAETELTRALGAARTNRQSAYRGKPSRRSPRETVAHEDRQKQQQAAERRKETPGGYEPAPENWQPPTRAAQPVAQSLPGVAPGEPTATDKDGNKMVYRNGKWEPLN